MRGEIWIKLISYDYRLLDQWVQKIVDISKDHNTKVTGPIPLPTKRVLFTFQKSPHVNKPAMEQFEKRSHRRLIILSGYSKSLMDYVMKMCLPSSLDLRLEIK